MFENWKLLISRGEQALEVSDIEGAIKYFKAAVKEAEKFGHNNTSLAFSLEQLAEALLVSKGGGEESVTLCFDSFERACNIYEAAYGPVHEKNAYCLVKMAGLLVFYNWEPAEKMVERAISIYEELDSSGLTDAVHVFALIQGFKGKKIEREKVLLNLVEHLEKAPELEPVQLAKSLLLLGQSTDNDRLAVNYLRQALTVIDGNCPDKELLVECNLRLGHKLFICEFYPEAQAAFETAVEFAQCSPKVADHYLEEALCRLSRLYLIYHGNSEEAGQLLERIREFREPENSRSLCLGADYGTELSTLASETGNYERYESFLRSSIDRKSKDDQLKLFVLFDVLALVKVLIDQERVDEALALLEEITPLQLENHVGIPILTPKIDLALASCNACLGRVEEAIVILDKFYDSCEPGIYELNVFNLLELEIMIGRKHNIERLFQFARTECEQYMTATSEEDPFQIYCAYPLTLSIYLAKHGCLDESRGLIERALLMGNQWSFLRAWCMAKIAKSFREDNMPELAVIIEERIAAIRAYVKERQIERGAVAISRLALA
jgi:tetratricopeptide (TPR) repeat protein